jgi:hypothetical protein
MSTSDSGSTESGSSGSPDDPQLTKPEAGQTQGMPEEPRRRRGALRIVRTIVSFILVLVAVLLVPVSVVSVFAIGEVSNTDQYVETVAPLAENPAIQAAVTDELTTLIMNYIDIDEISKQAVAAVGGSSEESKQLASVLAEPLKSGLTDFVHNKISELISSEEFITIWTESNRAAHAQIVSLLSGDEAGTITAEDGKVILNLGPLVAELKTALVAEGFTAAENIPEADATFVLYESDDISTVQSAYSAVNLLGFWLPIIAIAMALVGILVANRRRVATVGFGLGTLVAMIVVLIGTVFGRAAYLSAVASNGDEAAASATWDTVIRILVEGLAGAAVVGGVIAFAAILSGSNSGATAIRGEAKQAAVKVGDWIKLPNREQSTATARTATWLRVLAVIIAAGFLMFVSAQLTPANALWVTAGLLVVVFIIEIFTVARPAQADPKLGSNVDDMSSAGSE